MRAVFMAPGQVRSLSSARVQTAGGAWGSDGLSARGLSADLTITALCQAEHFHVDWALKQGKVQGTQNQKKDTRCGRDVLVDREWSNFALYAKAPAPKSARESADARSRW